MLFAVDIALSGGNCVQEEGRLELWRARLQDVGLMLSRKKTKHLPPPGKQKNIKLKEYNSTKYTSYKYFDTNLHQNGGCEKEVDLRISKAWNKWRELTGVLCD